MGWTPCRGADGRAPDGRADRPATWWGKNWKVGGFKSVLGLITFIL
ncbi:hypothetical protein GZL_05718 [Streptomyces sp. 769]|nr:hypothetical protein GZL_05718 [Streptomyces sp. 769]